jgi:hypothetical protein
VVDIGPHDEVEQPFLVFEGDEHVPLGRLPSQPFRLAQCLRRVIGIEATYSLQHGAQALRT